MTITRKTYIDDLLKNHIISAFTRNKCVENGIFLVEDLIPHVKWDGRLNVKGLSMRSNMELQAALEQISAKPKNVPKPIEERRLTRIISDKEQEKISDLKDLFNSKFLQSDNNKDESGFIQID